MPPVDRKNPIRAESSDSTFSLMEFMREFPDDDACMEWLWRERFSPDGQTAHCPKCGEQRTFKAYATKQRRGGSRTCTHCGHHLQVMAGTIFEGSSTSLHLWFYAIHLMTSTRCGIAAKQLERELGVTYKTAWRMFNKIRNELMADDGPPLTGKVEVDETTIEGKPRKHMDAHSAALYRERSRTTVLAAVERGGRARATVVPSRRGPELWKQVIQWINPDAFVYTDEWPAYRFVGKHFAAHSRINHTVFYVDGDIHTNTVEGFFGNPKTGIRGNYKKVSRRWLQGYLNEFVWRYNHRGTSRSMFRALLLRAARS